MVGDTLNRPLPTITAVDHNALVTSHCIPYAGANTGSGNDEAASRTDGGFFPDKVAQLLVQHTGGQTGQGNTLPPGCVLVDGELYIITDIHLRMLEPHELSMAQGFGTDYQHQLNSQGIQISKKDQTARVGNSVCPDVAEALILANIAHSPMVMAA